MTRSKWKGKKFPYFYTLLNMYSLREPLQSNYDIKMLWMTPRRECIFVPQLVGSISNVYNGKEWVKFYVLIDVILYQYGRVYYTKKRCVFKKNKKKKKSK